jgi:signal transduction histidine kinase
MKSRSAMRRAAPFILPLILLLASGTAFWVYLRSPNRGLPYSDSFVAGKADEWKAFGGTWELMNGSMRNDSDERGAKLLTGSEKWQNYSIEADVMLLGAGGDAGLVVRSSDEEEGVDAYTGYYAGLRNLDNMLVIGRAGHGWTEVFKPVALDQTKVVPTRWYHLKLLAYQCRLIAAANVPGQPISTTIAVNDADCIRSGRAGLRSYASGGAWRNVVIKPATERDVAAMQPGARPLDNQHPQQQADAASLNGFDAPRADYHQHALPSNPNAQPIASLRLLSLARPERATVRGTVILASPELFVQDATGGVLVHRSTHAPVRVGDEVEVDGIARPGNFSATLDDAGVRTLWGGTPAPAISVTASQAATGAFDATYVEVEARLQSKEYGSDREIILGFDAGPQSFRAIMKRGRGDSLYNRLKLGSLLRIRGVSVVDSAYTKDITPFAILIPSTDDIIVLAGPPWWSAGHLVAITIGLLLAALLGNFLYHQVENWRLRGIVEERERLAFEMHDTLAQGFAGIGFQLEAIRTGVPSNQPRMHQQIDLASELVRHSHAEARRTVDMLRPQQLQSEGLLTALTMCAQRLVEGGSVAVVANSIGEVQPVPLRISDSLYRIGQEAVANAVRHAHASTLTIMLQYKKDALRLLISDDGAGFTAQENQPGFGLLGMRKRAASIGAKLEIASAPGEGTQVSVLTKLPPRVTFASWPALLFKFLREHTLNVTTTKPPYPNLRRR